MEHRTVAGLRRAPMPHEALRRPRMQARTIFGALFKWRILHQDGAASTSEAPGSATATFSNASNRAFMNSIDLNGQVAVVTGRAQGIGFAIAMLPVARTEPGGAPLLTALFTATSAVCVTGLVVVDTAYLLGAVRPDGDPPAVLVESLAAIT